MSKKRKPLWNSDDNTELRKAVKNFNAKITRLAKKNPQKRSSLPEKVTVRELKEIITTRTDFNREIEALRRFSSVRGSERLVTVPNNQNDTMEITVWQKEEMIKRAKAVTRKRKAYKKKIGEVPVTSGGKPQGYTRGQLGMGTADETLLRKAVPFNLSDGHEDIKRRYKSFVRQSQRNYFNRREQQMKENYIKGITENYNPEDPEVKELIERIEEMDFNDFYLVFQAEDPNFEFSSPKAGQDPSEDYKEHLINSWNSENVRNIKNAVKKSSKKAGKK